MSNEISTKEFSDLICEAIIEERYFEKESFSLKVKRLAKVFRLKMASVNYEKVLKPNETAKLIRSTEIMNEENLFWRMKIRDLVDKETLQKYYNELDELREELFLIEQVKPSEL